jgi:hypothetical protein
MILTLIGVKCVDLKGVFYLTQEAYYYCRMVWGMI